jgi:dephospho-CoA kinase
MVILGLTGSIGMGKSTAAALLRRQGVPVHDADAAVHQLLAKGGAAVPAIAAGFPDVVVDGAVDRTALGAKVFGDSTALTKLEHIIHPLVRRATTRFLKAAARQRRRMVVLDIPLLFESKSERRCDAVVVVSAPAVLQRQRVLRRPGMSAAKLDAILARQLPDCAKRRRADVVISSGLGKAVTNRQLAHLVRWARRRRGRVWEPGYFRPSVI